MLLLIIILCFFWKLWYLQGKFERRKCFQMRIVLQCACSIIRPRKNESWHDSFLRVTWLILTCDMTHSYVWHDSCWCVAWLILTCDMTHSYVWHDSFLPVTWLILTLTWLILTCDCSIIRPFLTRWALCRSALPCVAMCVAVWFRVYQCVPVYCNVLRCVAMYGILPRCAAA